MELPNSLPNLKDITQLKYPGTNSTKGLTRVDGKKCQIYTMWVSMRQRCYNPNKYPTYIGCSVCERWLEFGNFRVWVLDQNWAGKELDKDIITPGNKVYCPEKCVFVSHQLNSLLNDHGAARGDYPLGVYLDKRRQKFQAKICINGGRVHIGYFDCQHEAHRAYVICKVIYIKTFIEQETDPRIVAGLRKHVARLEATMSSST